MQLLHIIRDLNKKYKEGDLKYFKFQQKNIEKISESELPSFFKEFKIFIINAYNYALKYKTIPIKFNYLYMLATINIDKELAMMLFFLFGSLYMNLEELLKNDQINWNYEQKKKTVDETEQFLKDIFSNNNNLENWFQLFMLNLFSEKEIFYVNINNFIILKEYINDQNIYKKYIIKIIKNYPDAFLNYNGFIEHSGLIVDKECSNISFLSQDEVFKIYDEEKNITYCLDEEEKDEYLRTKYNPYVPIRSRDTSNTEGKLFLNPLYLVLLSFIHFTKFIFSFAFY
jgi:hypothetical protein